MRDNRSEWRIRVNRKEFENARHVLMSKGLTDRFAQAQVARREPPPAQPHPRRKVLDPSHLAPAALEQQRRFGQALRDWMAAGADPSAEPQPQQEHTAVIRMRKPTSPAESVEMWVNETVAVLKQHAATKRERFLDDDGLPPGTEPISILDRRIYRLEEIVNDLRANG